MKKGLIRKYRRLIMAGSLLILLAGAACYTLFFKDAGDAGQTIYMEETVAYGTLMQGITESGSVTLEATGQAYELELEEDDEEEEEDDEEEKYLRIEEVYITPGQWIEEGEPVLSLTEKSISDVRRKLNSSQTDAEIALAEARNDYELGLLSAEQAYNDSVLGQDTAEAEYEITIQTLQKEMEGSAAQIQVLELEIEQTEQELEDTWEEFDELREAYEEAEYAFEHVEEDTITKYITLRDEWLAAKEKYESVRDSRLEQREQMKEKQEEMEEIRRNIESLEQKLARNTLDARQSMETASLEGSLSQDIYSYTVDSLKDAVDNAQEEADKWAERLAEFEAFVGSGTVCAQGSGLVMEVNYEADDYLSGTGDLFSYAKETDYTITVDILEEDIPYIKVGDSVNIEFTAYPGEVCSGVVSKITASASSEYSTTVSYPVTIAVEGDTSRLYGGMTGDVTFVTDQAQDVCYVSKKAVIEQEGGTYVYTEGKDGQKKLSKVETGFTDGISVQIVSGLKEGDVIYIESSAGAEGRTQGRE